MGDETMTRTGKPGLRALEDQAVVLTGATSGIGLATARRLGERGAKLVLVARGSAHAARACS